MITTRALMASITASMMLGTPSRAAAVSTFISQHRPTQPTEDHPQTIASADVEAIEKWLSTDREKAKSLDEIQAQFHQLTKQQVKAAINYLIDENRVLRTGQGTTASPYRYYHRKASDG